MPKIMLDKAYAGRKPGDDIEATELEIDALVAIGIVHRSPVADPQPEPEAIEQPVPMIPLNPPPADPEQVEDHEDHV